MATLIVIAVWAIVMAILPWRWALLLFAAIGAVLLVISHGSLKHW
jgi:hypothetical protein